MKHTTILSGFALLAAIYPLSAQSATVAAAGGTGTGAGGTVATGGVNGPSVGGTVGSNGVNGMTVGNGVANGGVNGPSAGATSNSNVITPNNLITPPISNNNTPTLNSSPTVVTPNTNTNNTTNTTTSTTVGTPNNGTTGPSSWNSQNGYWHDNYPTRTYYNSQRAYTSYEPAYHYGVDLYNQSGGKPFNQLNEAQVSSGWNNSHGTSNLSWTDAQAATRDAYDRMYQINHNGTNGTATTVVNGVSVTNR